MTQIRAKEFSFSYLGTLYVLYTYFFDVHARNYKAMQVKIVRKQERLKRKNNDRHLSTFD
jgi:hypothetical protein